MGSGVGEVGKKEERKLELVCKIKKIILIKNSKKKRKIDGDLGKLRELVDLSLF